MKPRILIVSQHFPPDNSGNASRIYDLSKNLVKQGVKVTAISPYPSFPHGSFKRIWKLHSSRKIDGINHISLFTWQPNGGNPSFVSRMSYYLIFPIHSIFWALLKRKDYDAILSTAPPIFTGITGYFIKKITGKKWFFDVRDLWINASIGLGFIKKGSLFEKVSRKYEKICYKTCDGITVTTEEIKNTISKTYNISKDKIKVIPNGVDIKTYKPVKEKKRRIIYSGNIGHAQDLEKVILAVKEINKKYPIQFYLVGDGDIKRDLEKFLKKEGLDNIVIFTGLLPRGKIPELIAESTIGVAPLKNLDTLKYAIPTKVYEYMSCGIPFIGTGSGEIELIAKNSGGGLVAKNTAESIYEQIVHLLENEQLMEKMGKNGRKFVEKYYDRSKIATFLLRNIEQVVA